MAKEKSLVKNKLNILDKIKMRLTIKKLQKATVGQGYNIWNEIKNEKIKFNPEILELAWSKSNTEDYKNFPTHFQEEKSNYISDFYIKLLSEEVQKNIIEKNPKMLGFVEENIRNDFFQRNPFKCGQYISKGNKDKNDMEQIEQILKINENPEILGVLPQNVQEGFVKKNPDYIYYCEKEVQKEILSGSKINDDLWRNVIKNDKNITLKKWIKYFITSLSSEYKEDKVNEDTKNRKTIKSRRYYNKYDDEELEKGLSKGIEELLNSCDEDLQKSIIKEIETINEEENRELIIKSFNELLKSKKLSIHQQKEILPILFKNEEIIGRESFNKKYWDIQAINENFEQKYGIEKFKEYEDLINKINNGNILPENSNRILRLFFKEETIIKNVDSKKVIDYIEMYDEYSKNKKSNENTFKLMAEGRKVRKSFQEIIKDAFGEKALEIIEKRPGISLFNISNTEIFNENIINNFSQDFIDDCLSYNFANYDNWIEQMKNPEDVEAFKYYFDITSQKIGENAETMQNCMLKYNEFRELLIDASTKESITAEQKESITKLCMWPLNICDVQKVEDLENINQKLQIKLKELNEDEKIKLNERLKVTSKYREYTGRYDDKILYNLGSRDAMNEAELTQEEIDVLEYFNKEDYRSANEKIIDSGELKDITGLFLNTRLGIKKLKDYQMKELNNQFTNMEKINEAIENGEYGVKKIEVEGFAYIDLGQMPVNFAVHDPRDNNSEIEGMQMNKGELTKEALESYLEYEEEDGVSTISAHPSNNDDKVTKDVTTNYIYWNLEGNEVVHLSEVDGQVCHGKKMVYSSGWRDRIPINKYKSISKSGGEIAFYRRKREHTKDKNQKYGRKIIPDAAIGVSEYGVLKRFGKPIPIIVRRGYLNENNIEKFKQEKQKEIQEARARIEEEKNMFIEDEFDR